MEDEHMRRAALIAAGAAAGLLALRAATKGRRPEMMEKVMSRCWEMMPEQAPPVRLLHELSAIREQNDRILESLDKPTSGPS